MLRRLGSQRAVYRFVNHYLYIAADDGSSFKRMATEKQDLDVSGDDASSSHKVAPTWCFEPVPAALSTAGTIPHDSTATLLSGCAGIVLCLEMVFWLWR